MIVVDANLLVYAVSAGMRQHEAARAWLAIEHGLTLCSTDGDFGRFPGVRWEDPLLS